MKKTNEYDDNVYGSGLNNHDWGILHHVVFPFIHSKNPSEVIIPEVPDHLKMHPMIEAIKRYQKSNRDEDLDQAGQGLLPSEKPFGWYLALTK